MESIELRKAEAVELKNAQLAASAGVIFAKYDKLGKMTRETVTVIAKELAKVEESKSYKEDGFKSAAEFAESYCGLKHSQAYNFVRWGEAISKPDCPQAIKDMGPSNYAEVKALGYEAVQKAVQDNEISADMTQDQLKAYAKAHKPNADKPKVLKCYNVSIPMLKRDIANVTEVEVDQVFNNEQDTALRYEVLKAKPMNGEAMRKVYVAPDGHAYVALFYPITEATTKKATVKKVDYQRGYGMYKNGLNVEVINDILGTSFGEIDVKAWEVQMEAEANKA